MSNILRSNTSNSNKKLDEFEGVLSSTVLAPELFSKMLSVERKRSERSKRRFVLMLLELENLAKSKRGDPLNKILLALSHTMRETDIMGWYGDLRLGVILTEIGSAEGKTVARALLTKVVKALSSTLSIEQIDEIRLSFHVFPEDAHDESRGDPFDSDLYPDVAVELKARKASAGMKRCIDVVGSLSALVLASPVLAAISIAIKLTSKGPVLFQQERVGQGGKKFAFLKFRSMSANNDHSIHQEYVTRLISGTNGCEQPTNGEHPVYKLTNDSRVTPIGRILRRTSLDELPQFLNVLLGQMSLVGPRPPIAYEFEAYDIWHRRRLLSVKPGITGIWQVGGRSKVKFDDMVRMDLKYASSWTVWMDIKILLQTPRAVVMGSGAF
jgi:lipopolysaccharide/colanic/teichoic acid biosynthesis glycosyltransferase